jgi:hypothetical protein
VLQGGRCFDAWMMRAGHRLSGIDGHAVLAALIAAISPYRSIPRRRSPSPDI